jgi:predicted transcriptional regulator
VASNATLTLTAAASLPGYEAAEARFDLLVVPAPVNSRVPEPPVHVEDRSGLIVVFAGGAVLVLVAGLAITETGKYSGMFLFIPLYTRMKKTAVLDNFSRGQLHGYIVANPGVHMNAIRDRFGLSNGEVAYHLRVLEREGLVSSMSDGLRRRFYPGESGPRDQPHELTFAQNLLVSLMEKSPGITGTELARLTDTSPQVVNYHLKRLWRMELITMDRDGRVVRCFVRPERLGLFKRAGARTGAAETENTFQETA